MNENLIELKSSQTLQALGVQQDPGSLERAKACLRETFEEGRKAGIQQEANLQLVTLEHHLAKVSLYVEGLNKYMKALHSKT